MISYACITDASEKKQAFALVARKYAASGYVADTAQDVSGIAQFLHSAQAVTIGAYREGVLVGTISAVGDGDAGLPMDSIYRDELAPLRALGTPLAEVCQFAVDIQEHTSNEHTQEEREVSIGLLAHVVRFGVVRGYSHLVFTINPKHAMFYELLGAERIGEEKAYPSVQHAPALAYALSLHDVIETGKKHFLIEKIRSFDIPESFFATH